jgi:soluble lytic murein transglycosylase-like protein
MRQWILFLTGALIGALAGGVQIHAWAAPNNTEVAEAVMYLAEKDIEVPPEVEKACIKAGKKYHISPEILEALAWKESRYVQKAISDNGKCQGLCQVNPYTHCKRMKRLNVTDVYDINGNVLVAADLLAELLEENDDMAYALDRYNGNPNAESYYNKGKVSGYAGEILKVSEALELLHTAQKY